MSLIVSDSEPAIDGLPPPKKRRTERNLEKDENIALRKQYIAPSLTTHYRKPLKIHHGEGVFLIDEQGRAFMDCINNVTHVGHCHPDVVKAYAEQAGKLYWSPTPNHALLQQYTNHLLSKFPKKLDFVLFVNSGSEANDLALQIAEAVTGHTEVICIEGAYHGHTKPLMGLSTYKSREQNEGTNTFRPNPHAWVAPLPDTYRGKYQDPKTAGRLYAGEVKEIIDTAASQGKKIASFLCEAFVGCAGQVQLPDGFLKATFDHIHTAGGLCIIDEVQTGFGRAGDYFWVFESQGVCPDMVTVGKPMGNGHPVSAVITTREIAMKFAEVEGLESLDQYCSDPVSLAVAEAVLTVLEEEDRQAHAKKLGDYVMDGVRQLMEKHPCIGDVRGFGLFIGVEIVKARSTREPDGELAKELIEGVMLNHQILLMNDGMEHNVVKIKPPLCFTKENADSVLKAIDQTLQELGH